MFDATSAEEGILNAGRREIVCILAKWNTQLKISNGEKVKRYKHDFLAVFYTVLRQQKKNKGIFTS